MDRDKVKRMTRVFYIKGKSNSGKSGAIKYTMKMLLELKDSEVLYVSFYRRHDKGYHSSKDELIGYINTSIENGLTSDRNIGLVMIEIKGKVIGLTTYGDSLANEIKLYYQDAMEVCKGKLDGFVCARHDINIISEEFKSFANGFQVIEPAISSVGLDKNAGTAAFDKDNYSKGKVLFDQIVTELGLE